MDLGISGKLAIVTGAGRGLGREVVKELTGEGARVVAVSRSSEPLESLSDELGSSEQHCEIRAVDLMEDGAPTAFANDVVSNVGVPDIVVHNMGGSLRVTEPLAAREDWERVWQHNLGVAIEINNILIPMMIERGWGRVILVSTNATLTFQAYGAYVSAKAALNAYVKTVGREVSKDGIVISAVMPGPIFAEDRYLGRMSKEDPIAWEEYVRNHLPIARLGQVDEIAPWAVFLASEQASFAVGTIVNIDGGSM